MKTFHRFLAVTAVLTTAILCLAGCAGEQVSTDNAGVQHTNYVANPTVTQAATMATNLAPVAAATVPQPYGAMVGLGLGLLGLLSTGIASAIAVAKNKQANEHASTLQAVTTGIETALPSIQQALTTTVTSGVAPGANSSLTTANAVLSAVKQSIASATSASGTSQNLNTVLAQNGIGPTAP